MKVTAGRLLALVLGAGFGCVQAAATPQFVHGAWVNVRQAPNARAAVLDHVNTNDPVLVTARQGDWCAIRYGEDRGGDLREGFVSCRLLGGRRLTLDDAADNPARAFWIAPSLTRLLAYGAAFKPLAQPDDLSGSAERYGATFRRVPEFNAALARMEQGFDADAQSQWEGSGAAWPGDVSASSVLEGYAMRPAPIAASLFRSDRAPLLVNERNVEVFAARQGARLSLALDGMEKEKASEVYLASARIYVDPPVQLYGVWSNGQVTRVAVRSAAWSFEVDGACRAIPDYGQKFTGAYETPDAPPLRSDADLLIARFDLPGGLQLPAQARVRWQREPIRAGVDWPKDDLPPGRVAQPPEATVAEVDLDGDGVADVLRVELPIGMTELGYGVKWARWWWFNVDGQWVLAARWNTLDCD